MPDQEPPRALRLFNTMGRQVGDFVPRHPPQVTMYSCGPTVYDNQHIGNIRPYVFADTLKRVLAGKGLDVRHVINITDVGHLTSDADEGEDKLELAARRQQGDAWQLAAHYTSLFQHDLERLGVAPPDVWCRATDHIEQMVRFAHALQAGGWCYRLPSGLYFDTSKDPGYGRLALLDLHGQKAGARVEVAEGKRNAQDFAIWRTSGPDERRQMEWPSPWGAGAPGWHLECSVMSIEYLGRHFDIHTGGSDHPPVHHTNELAQSEAYLADGQPWVNWWLHCEFINLKGAKISKSAGGTVLLQDLMDRGYHPLVYRYLLLQAHYRSQAEFSWEALDGARTTLRRLLDRFAPEGSSSAQLHLSRSARGYLDAFDRALSDDLNTAEALAVANSAARDRGLAGAEMAKLGRQFDRMLGVGFGRLTPAALDIKAARPTISTEQVEALVARRQEARAARDFSLSDELRDQLAAMGVAVEDQPGGGSSWRWA